jgi:hypothetical protein
VLTAYQLAVPAWVAPCFVKSCPRRISERSSPGTGTSRAWLHGLMTGGTVGCLAWQRTQENGGAQ